MMKLIELTAILYNKKCEEEFYNICRILDGEKITVSDKYSANKIWYWGLNRWGKKWPETEYDIREQITNEQNKRT